MSEDSFEKLGAGRYPCDKEISMIDGIGLFADILPKRRAYGLLRWLITFCICVGIAELLPDSPAVIIIFAAWLAGNLIRHFQKRHKRYRMLEDNVTVWDIRIGFFGCPEDKLGKNHVHYVKFTDAAGLKYEAKLRIGSANALSAPGTDALLAVYGSGNNEGTIGIVPAFPVYAEYLRRIDTYDDI